jgi:hypothetical protein
VYKVEEELHLGILEGKGLNITCLEGLRKTMESPFRIVG